MKMRLTRLMGLVLLAGATSSSTGCFRYTDCVDVCYPERYNAMARQEVIAGFAPQVSNGHILDQTVWNYHFVPGTEALNAAGLERLDYLVRRRPAPDTKIFLATARDLKYDSDNADRYVDLRRDLDSKRVDAIQKYLGVQTSGRPLAFEILVHDPTPVGYSGQEALVAIARQRVGAQGGIGAGLTGAVGGGGVFGGAGNQGAFTNQGNIGTLSGTGNAPGGGVPPR